MTRSQIFCSVLILLAFTSASIAQTKLLSFNSTWKYKDDGSDQGTAWRSPAYSDSGWPAGQAQFGFGDGDEQTIVSYGTDPDNKYITYYFRTTFQVNAASDFTTLTLRFRRDDGGVVYINGTEVLRSNMPGGAISYTTLASTSSETTVTASAPASVLVNGTNVVAVEVHQNYRRSPDLSFDLEIKASTLQVVRGPYLQMNGDNAITVKWRTDAPSNARLWYSKNSSSQDLFVEDPNVTTDHSITLTGLSTNARYYYKVATATAVLSPRYDFYTPPDNGHPLLTRMWILGDSGNDAATAAAVRNAYTTYSGTAYTNLMLLPGGSAYEDGSDDAFQTKFFDVMKAILPRTLSFAVLGEQEANNSPVFSDLPLFHIFDTPGPLAGGYPSGTPKYYSFNYGSAHFVVLDSYASSATGDMTSWLEQDLAANKRSWLIALWHHAPYSKGNHDSDSETEMTEMRSSINKVLEDYGVDLILGAHSNTYERSFYIDGHYGFSSTFSNANIKNGGDGRPTGNGAYIKAAGSTHSGTVYAVMGSSSGAGIGPLNYPAMYMSASQTGSLALTLNCAKLDASFIRSDGTVADTFSIQQTNLKPNVAITSPPSGSVFTAGSTITITASADDPDSWLRRVRFLRDGIRIATVFEAPYTTQWTNVPAGTYSVTAIAEDDLCGSRTSTPITITVQ